MCTCSQFLQCVCVDCCLLGGWVGPWTVFLGDWWALSFSPSLMLTLSAFLPFFSAGFQCLSLLLLPPCPSWLHRYLWLALWPGCRRAVSVEAKTHTHTHTQHFPRYLRQLFQLPNTEHALCSSCLIRPLPKLNWFLLDSTHYVSFY